MLFHWDGDPDTPRRGAVPQWVHLGILPHQTANPKGLAVPRPFTDLDMADLPQTSDVHGQTSHRYEQRPEPLRFSKDGDLTLRRLTENEIATLINKFNFSTWYTKALLTKTLGKLHLPQDEGDVSQDKAQHLEVDAETSSEDLWLQDIPMSQ